MTGVQTCALPISLPRVTEALQRYVALPEDIERDNGNAFLFLSEIAQKQNDNAGAI